MRIQATEIRINGIVQGVGFRPFVYRQATKRGLKGFITNNSTGVAIRVAGDTKNIESFIEALQKDAPPLARIVSLDQSETTLTETTIDFSIQESETGRTSNTHVSPDIATCHECSREISDKSDRRHNYPFTNCTNCGPRFTIIRSLPYDRPATTMHKFTMCPACLAEYENPSDRRFHAQPNACKICGPQLSWHDTAGNRIPGNAPLETAAEALKHDQIIAIKGLGGFHLAASAYSHDAITRLRKRKNRPCKPLAVMAKDLATAKKLCFINQAEQELLTAAASPIVLLRKRPSQGLAENLAPGIEELGVMLPYTPLHQLLFNHSATPNCLVMTSGNAGGEPLCRDNHEAINRLSVYCDGFLMHNRDIHTRVDDSVIRRIAGKPSLLRRSRGYAPASVRLDFELPPILAVGAELKNCFCLTRNQDVFTSQHIGDLNNLATLDFFEETYKRLKGLLEIEPQHVVADLHPDYLSTQFAGELDLPLISVQHHWAHAASVMAEHGLTESLAIILDGTGYGPDKTIWGGEVLHCNLREYKRLGRLPLLPMPGGDMAARQPWRMAVSALHTAHIDSRHAFSNLDSIPLNEKEFIQDMITKEINAPLTSSCGRLFDAVASLLGICHINTFEGQAAMELETLASKVLGNKSIIDTHFFHSLNQMQLFTRRENLQEVATETCINFIIDGLQANKMSIDELSLFFHVFLVSAFGNMILYLSEQIGIQKIVLSGGCAQNRLLVEGFYDFFADSGCNIKLFTNTQVPANDGGLALGQAVIGGTHVSSSTDAR